MQLFDWLKKFFTKDNPDFKTANTDNKDHFADNGECSDVESWGGKIAMK